MRNFFHIFLSLVLIIILYGHATNGTPINVGVVLDMESWTAKISTSCMYMAISDFYDAHPSYKTRLILHERDSNSEVTGAAFAAIDLLQKVKVEVIIGPQKSEQTEFLVDLGEKTKTPIVSFSATNPSVNSRSPYFVRTTPDDHTQVRSLAEIAKAFGWTKVIFIHENTDYGNRLVPHLVDAFKEADIHISHRSVISPYASDDEIFEELQKLVVKKTSIFIVHMSALFGSRFFLKVKEMGMMTEGYAWVITNGLMNVLPWLEPNVIDSMQGVLGVDSYIPTSERLENFTTIWKKKFIQDNPERKNAEMITFGLQAYDSIWALAMAAEKVHDAYSDFEQEDDRKTLDFLGMPISRRGAKLLEQILSTEFEGLSGYFRLIKGQLEPMAFKILNINGTGGKEIGFWTKMHGISKDLDLQGDTIYSTSSENLQNIIWPGESSTIPKGWVIPMGGKKLRIGVPIQEGFNDLISVRKDPFTNASIIEGYCIDVFTSAIALLPHAIPYELVPFHVGEKDNSSYNDLIQLVFTQNFDAVVGDVTITANRSSYVDFALPYTEGGLWMIVPLRRKSLQPLPTHLVILSMLFFSITSLLIWTLEQGPPKRFPMKLFVNLEKIASKYRAYHIKIIWFMFCAWTILYILWPMFTPDKIEPSVTDFNELIKNGEPVGYAQGSFIADLLKQFHFDESQLRPCSSAEECHELLSKGSENTGVSAIFDEMPYVNIFLAKYCTKYTKIGPTHNTDGYGFVFPIGSPIVSDFSQAIRQLTQKFVDDERAWFRPNITCEEGPLMTFTSKDLFSLFPVIPFIVSFAITIASTCLLKIKKKSS